MTTFSVADLPDLSPAPEVTPAKVISREAPTPAPVPEAQPAETPKEVARRLKLKVNGIEEELDEAEVIRLAQMGKSANQKFQEASQMRKQAEQFIDALKRDPRSVLSNPALGVDLRKFAEDYLLEQMQEEALSPEQKKTREIERELAKYKDAEAKAKAETEQKQAAELQQKYAADYERKILSALDQGGVPKTKSTVRRMAYYLQQAVANDLDLEPSDLVAQVRKDYQDEHRELYEQAGGDQLLQLLGEGVAKKIRDSDIKRLKTTQSRSFDTPASRSPRSDKPQRAAKQNGADWKDAMKREFLGK